MPSKTSASAFTAGFCDRVKWARQSQGLTQAEAAKAVGIEQDHYKHFESSRVLSPELVEAFCRATSIDANWLFWGDGRAPFLSRKDAEERMPSRPRKPKKRTKAA